MVCVKLDKKFWDLCKESSLTEVSLIWIYKFREFKYLDKDKLLEYLKEFYRICKTSMAYKKFIKKVTQDFKYHVRTEDVERYLRYIYFYIHARENNVL